MKTDRGFVAEIVTILIAFFALSMVFGVDVIGAINNSFVRDIITTVWDLIVRFVYFVIDLVYAIINLIRDTF